MLLTKTSLLFVFISITCRFVNCKRVKRVVGGMEVPCGVHNEVASLRNASSQHLCGAVLITKKIALTAAHCVLHPQDNYILYLNNYCVSDKEDIPRAKVLDVILHPLYDESYKEHDIAVLRLRLRLDDVTWIKNVLPDSTFGISGSCVIYGYGYYDGNRRVSDTLRAANLELISLDICSELLGKYVAPEPNSGMLCASGYGSDACQGDSGGPLICAGKVQGLSSYGLTCSMEGLPGVYTSIGPHLHWIMGFLEADEK